jgi:hypothetical protein
MDLGALKGPWEVLVLLYILCYSLVQIIGMIGRTYHLVSRLVVLRCIG